MTVLSIFILESNHDMSVGRSLKSDSIRMHKITTFRIKRKNNVSQLNQIKNILNITQQVSVSKPFIYIMEVKPF